MFSTASPDCDLVRPHATGGFPTEYLLARIGGRQAALASDWRGLTAMGPPADSTDERIWGAFLTELAWLHRQMDDGLRRRIVPLLALFELKTIVLVLRSLAARRTGGPAALLQHSLLVDQLQSPLRQMPDVETAVDRLAAWLTESDDAFRELVPAYRQHGLRGVEEGLMRGYLEHVARADLHPAVRTFFEQLIDVRNVMLAYRYLRWNAERRPQFIRGGSSMLAELDTLVTNHDRAALDSLMMRMAGHPGAPTLSSESAVETLLMRSIARRLRPQRRDADGVGAVVAYIWRIYVQARNFAVLYHARALPPALVDQELLQ